MGKVLYFPKDKIMKNKIDPELLAMMMRNHVLIAEKRKRGFSAEAIAKAVVAAEQSKRQGGNL